MGGKNHGKVTDEERKQTLHLQDEEKIAAEEKDAEIAVEEKNAVGKRLPAVAGVGQGCDDKAEEEEDEHGDVDDDEDDGANDEGEEAVRWVTHYSSGQEILLVGEGDFSFSLSLARSFRSASNIVATSLDNYSQVTSKYSRAKSNIGNLKKMGARLLHGVDATQMKHHKDLKLRKFDRIIFNFPHAGFKGKEEDLRLINMHKKLVYGFFRDASHMIRQDGEIHISHKTSFPFCQWKLEELASYNSLVLFKCVDFKIGDYPGYNNKRGDGQRCDQPFHLGKCCTFMFQIGKPLRRKPPAANVANLGGMLLSTPLPQRRSNFVPIESEG
ncbi:hypothetical protein Taro_056016, partial [Colocasia esculenta]|nr:hypothetical protein [Colocasia esculenta]